MRADQLANYYQNIMQDSGTLTPEQTKIKSCVNSFYNAHLKDVFKEVQISPDMIDIYIMSLKGNTAAGVDGIFSEHLNMATR